MPRPVGHASPCQTSQTDYGNHGRLEATPQAYRCLNSEEEETAMTPGFQTPFDSIEDAHDFMTLLAQTVFETKLDLEADIQKESASDLTRRAEALKLTLYTLNKLEFHMNRSRRVLNDLRTLRRLLFEERTLSRLTARPKADRKARADTLLPPAASRSLSKMNSSVGAA